jgi:hypothetical protein
VQTSRLTRITAAALTAAALVAPTASAREWSELGVDRPAPESPTVVTVHQGFDTGSAALGAGAATGLLLLTAAGGTAVVRRHRRPGGGS